MPRCIFRYQYNDGVRCTKDCLENCQYCNRHKNKKNYIFEVMNMATQNEALTCENDLFEIFKYIYDNNTYDVKSDTINNDDDNKKYIFFALVAYLLSKVTVLNILYKTIYLNGRVNINKSKSKIISYLHSILYNTYCIAKENTQICKVVKIQRFVRRHLYRKIVTYNMLPSENTEDPFTFDSIDEIDCYHKFSYQDVKGHIYTFNAIELEYFIRQNGNWNPYTKDDIPEYIINRLKIFMQHNNLVCKQENDFVWQTALHAYTDVSQIMEKAGFYTNVEWFNLISFEIAKKIINTYRNHCRDLVDSNKYFPTEFEVNRTTFEFEFCKETINLFKDADEHYLLCCNFMKALAVNVREFALHLPRWLLEDTTSTTNRTPTLFMYIQSMLDDINDIDNEEDIYYDLITSRQLSLTATVTANFASIIYDRF